MLVKPKKIMLFFLSFVYMLLDKVTELLAVLNTKVLM